jgi:2-dehydropantoate 2-reductase
MSGLTPVTERFAVLGAGAVGCYFGGMLARAGRPVTLVGRAAHVHAIASRGLRIESARFDEYVPVHATERAADAADADVVLVCVKSPDTERAARELLPHLRSHARLLSLQNGVDNARRIRSVVPNPVFAAVVYVGAEMAGPGHVRHTGRGELRIGPLASERSAQSEADARAIARTLSASGVPCEVAGNIEAELWTKLALNCAFNAISALGASDYARMVATPSIRALMPDIVAEVVAVARADGVTLDADTLLADCHRIAETMPQQISSTAQDIRRGKPTEIDALNGYVAERARALGIAAPVNRALHALVKLRESA